MDWKKLQNGSDIRGVAIEGVEGEAVNLSAETAYIIGKAFVEWLRRRNTGRLSVAVGVDSRISGPMLSDAIIKGICESGADAVRCGLASTPAMFMITIDSKRPCSAGIMITASHLPYNRNGFKFFTPEGGLEKADISEILEIAEDFDSSCPSCCDSEGGSISSSDCSLQHCAGSAQTAVGTVSSRDYMSEYSAILVDYIRRGADAEKPLEGMKIVVDAGNGAGGFFATDVLRPLGADISTSQFLEPDGMFPNHVPNPENAEAMDSICSAVVRSGADLGIIFDTDVDRSAIVDRQGSPINRNSLIALISDIILREHPGSTIVTDSITSVGLAECISTRGGIHHRFKRGYKNVINESKRLNSVGQESWIAIETSGHCALRENYYLDDGAFLVAKLLLEAAKLARQGRELGSLIADLRQPLEDKEIRFKITEEDFAAYGSEVLEFVRREASNVADWSLEEPNFEGVRVNCSAPEESGWFLLRLSLHDPVLPLNIESDVRGGVAIIEQRLRALLKPVAGGLV
jgi:phosphomannomutase